MKKEIQAATTNLALSDEMQKLYQESANLGTENLGAAIPLLKIHSTGKSVTNVLENGEEPNNGALFYTDAKIQAPSFNTHIMAIGPGFRAPSKENPSETRFNQLFAGVIEHEDKLLPFATYISGMKCSNFFDFTKTIRDISRNIPMFALTVKLGSEQVKTEKFGKVWVFTFEILRQEDGRPVSITQPEKFLMLRDKVHGMVEKIEAMSVGRAVEQEPEAPLPTDVDNF